MELSVVIPAFDEQDRITGTLRSALGYLRRRDIDYEVIVVDDGSKDRTREVVEGIDDEHVLLTPPRENKGKGYSVRQGVGLAKKEWVLFMDADNSTPLDQFDRFLPHLDEAEVLVGSRNLPGSTIQIKQPWLRSKLGKIFPLVVRLLAVRGLQDTQCGFKAFRRDAAKRIFERSRLDRWGFDVELLFIAKRLGYKVKELPITWSNDPHSKVRPIKDAIDMFGDLLRIRANQCRGRYR